MDHEDGSVLGHGIQSSGMFGGPAPAGFEDAHPTGSLFGGRGKAVHALLGGLVIAAIANGLGLLGVSAAGTYMVTALVLIAAAAVDSLVRRRGSSTTS